MISRLWLIQCAHGNPTSPESALSLGKTRLDERISADLQAVRLGTVGGTHKRLVSGCVQVVTLEEGRRM